MEVGFQFEIVYKDVHLLETRISVRSGLFSGVANVYVGLNQLQETAGALQGFPSSTSDIREITFGVFDPESPPGRRVKMRFYCIDKSGHAYVDSTMESDCNAAGKIQSISVSLPVEPAAVDSFVEELHILGTEKKGTARLKGRLSFR